MNVKDRAGMSVVPRESVRTRVAVAFARGADCAANLVTFDCGAQLTEALALVAARGGAVLYLRQEGRGIGLYNKVDAYVIQNGGYNTDQGNPW